MIAVLFRHGIGLDIEYSDDAFYPITIDNERTELGNYQGVVIKIPFFSIYIGDFYQLDE